MKKNNNIKKPISKKVAGRQKPKQHISIDGNKYFNILSLSIIMILGIIIYSNSFDCTFHFDDAQNIRDNPVIRGLSNIKAIWNFNHTRFIPYLSFAVNYHFGKLNIWGYHFVNLLIHLLNAALVWWLTLLIFSSPNIKTYSIARHKKTIALIIGLLFVSHPLATESVTYIVQRMASMAALFYFLTIALYLKGRLFPIGSQVKYVFFAGSFLAGCLALLTKENTYTIPFAIVLVEFFFLQQNIRLGSLKNYRTIAFGSLLIIFIIFIFNKYSSSIFKSVPPDEFNDFRTFTSTNYLLTQFSAIIEYIRLLIIPVNQNLDYDFQLSNSFFEVRTLINFGVLISLLGLAIFLFNKNRSISFGILWFFLTLSIESGIIPISDLIVEHRTYIPSFGFFMILTSVIFTFIWEKNKLLVLSIFMLIIFSNSYLTYQRNKIWKEDITLWNDVVSKSPNKARAHYNRGVISENINKDAAIEDYKKAIELKPMYSLPYNNLGKLIMNDKPSDALKDFNKAIELGPQHIMFYVNRGGLLSDMNKNGAALMDFNKAIRMDSNNSQAYYDRGNLFLKEKKHDLAIHDFNKTIQLDPKVTDAYVNRGSIFMDEKKDQQALDDFNHALLLDPNHFQVYNNIGLILLNEKKYQDAIAIFTKVINIKSDFVIAYANRGSAELGLGQKDKACMDFQKAFSLGFQPIKEAIDKFCH